MNAALLKPRPRDRQATEQALIAAAVSAFSEYGYEGTTTKAIAEAANCSEALIQRYFNGKEGLLLAVLQRDGGPFDSKSFFARPLCGSLRGEAKETLNHIVGIFTNEADRLRIVLSRVFLDRAFKDYFNSICTRGDLKGQMIARLGRYSDAGMLDPKLDFDAAAEMLLTLSFELGFMQSQVLHVSQTERRRLLGHFAEFIARAFGLRGGPEPPPS